LAVDRACVAGSLAETDLELPAAAAGASRLILDGGGGWDCRQSIAAPISGAEVVVANPLIARAAFDHGIPAKLNLAAVGAGLDPGLGGLSVVAGCDAGATHRGTIDREPFSGSPGHGGGEENEAGCRKKKTAHGCFGALGRPSVR